MHTCDLVLEQIIDEAVPRERVLPFERGAHDENRIVLSAAIRLVYNLQMRDGYGGADGALEFCA